MPDSTEWTEDKKIQWLIENGTPKYYWFFERVDNVVYKRPTNGAPPWIDKERVEVRVINRRNT